MPFVREDKSTLELEATAKDVVYDYVTHKWFEWDGADWVEVPGGGGIGTPGGAANSIQFNNAGAFGGFGSWDGTTLAIPGAANSLNLTGSSTGNPTTLTATGGDANVILQLLAKQTDINSATAPAVLIGPKSTAVLTDPTLGMGASLILVSDGVNSFGKFSMASFFGTEGNGSDIILASARGTKDAPSALQSGDLVAFGLDFYGYGTSSFIQGAAISAFAEGNFSGDVISEVGSAPTYLYFGTTAAGNIFTTERMRIRSTGDVAIFNLTASNLVATDASKNLISLPLNTYLTSAGAVTSINETGSAALVGAVTLTGGSGITLTQTGQDISIAAAGSGTVTSIDLLGTANQVVVTGTSPITTSGSWTLSLPQSIATTSTPRFARLGLGQAADATAPLIMSGLKVLSTGAVNLGPSTGVTGTDAGKLLYVSESTSATRGMRFENSAVTVDLVASTSGAGYVGTITNHPFGLFTVNGNAGAVLTTNNDFNVRAGKFIGWSNTGSNAVATIDAAFQRNNAGVIEVTNGTTGQWGALIAGTRDAGTTTVTNGLTIGRQSSGTPAAGLGSALLFNINSSTTADQNAAQISALWTTATHASRTADIVFKAVNNAAALAEVARISAAGAINAVSYKVGGVAGASFGPAAPASITVVNGIITAIS